MADDLRAFLDKVRDLPLFEGVDFSNVNAVSADGDNALHVAVRWQDVGAIKSLLAAGVNVNQHGDLGHTPLHEACMGGSLEIVRLLVEHGADLFALTEGHPPFTTARLANHDRICDYLAEDMERRQREDPEVHTRARIRQLRAEIERLEMRLADQVPSQGSTRNT